MAIINLTKSCPRCKEEKDISCFNKNALRKDGLQTYCKQCQSIISRESVARNPKRTYPPKLAEYLCIQCNQLFQSRKRPDRVVQYCSRKCHTLSREGHIRADGTKICSRCKILKDLSCFTAIKGKVNKVVSMCKDCSRQDTRDKRAANPEQSKQERHEYYLRNKEYIHAKSKEWVAQNKEARKAIEHRHYQKNRARFNAKVRKRRHIRRANGGEFTEQEWLDLCDAFGNLCVDCGDEKKLTVDHIVPVSLGGTSYIDNIQPLCLSCNSRKRDKIIDYRLPWKRVDFLTRENAPK